MYAVLTIVRYPSWLSWAGFMSMAFFRLPMMLNRQVSFYKLLGCGKNGTFDKTPDLQQWGILTVTDQLPPSAANNNELTAFHHSIYGSFIAKWWKLYKCETWTITLEPIEGHGLWDGRKAFGDLPKNTDYEGVIAVITRATIHLNKLKQFWKHVDGVASLMADAPGFITSLGIGEAPLVKQATFSVWQSKEAMKNFSYKMKEHTEVIRKTHQEKWYKEDMFTRFKILASHGTIKGQNPLQGKL